MGNRPETRSDHCASREQQESLHIEGRPSLLGMANASGCQRRSTRTSSRRRTAASASWNIFSRLLKDRIVFLGSEIDDDVANIIIAQFLFLESEDPDKDIQLYINSPGGVVTAGLAIYDTMQYVRCPVSTICIGQAASMGAVLLAAGAQGPALRAAARPHHDPPAARRRARSGDGHRDPGPRDPAHEGRAHGHPGRARRARTATSIAKDIERDFYLARRAGQGVRPHRRSLQDAKGDPDLNECCAAKAVALGLPGSRRRGSGWRSVSVPQEGCDRPACRLGRSAWPCSFAIQGRAALESHEAALG